MNPTLPLRVCFVLPGLHRVHRGAETAFEAIASELARSKDFAVTLIGSGAPKAEKPYQFIRAPSIPREHFEAWPKFGALRNAYRWEELTFAPALWQVYQPGNFDVSVTCSYPFTNWLLRLGRKHKRPRHVFVTQNGDWAPQRRNMEYRLFSCDGLICTNPEYFHRHQNTWKSSLIPNGFNPETFKPALGNRAHFNLPQEAKIVLLASALVPSKRVLEAVRAVATLPDAFLVVAGDGPLREVLSAEADRLLPGRYRRLHLPIEEMPALYQCANTLLHMARDEAFGNVYVEAMGVGLPIVAHESPTTRWILQDESPTPRGQTSSAEKEHSALSWLVDTDNLNAVSNALKQALNGSNQNALRRHALAAKRFSWEKVAQQYGRFFKQTAAL